MYIITGYRLKYLPRRNGHGVWSYIEKNRPEGPQFIDSPTLVWLHGLGADKNGWFLMLRHIPNKYHSVVLDMPGHGETTFLKESDRYSLEGYARSVREFFELTGLDKRPIYLIG